MLLGGVVQYMTVSVLPKLISNSTIITMKILAV